MDNLLRKNYRLYLFFAALLLICISLEFAAAVSYSYSTLLGDGIFLILFVVIASASKKDFDLMGSFGAVVLVIFIVCYGWRFYDWMSNGNLFDNDNYTFYHFADSHTAGTIFLLCHGLKTICGLFGLMLQVTVFSNPPE